MSETPRHKQILQSNGPAAGRIKGINHLVLFSNDVGKSVTFYRDILGMKIVRTQKFSPQAMAAMSEEERNKGTLTNDTDGGAPVTQIFFDMGNGELLSIYCAPEVTHTPDAPLVPHLWPAGMDVKAPVDAQKLDHLAFNVETRAELEWFQKHLRDNGVPVSEVIDRQGAHRFVLSIYFFDPSNNPLEIATLDLGDPGWEGYDFTSWFRDEDPVPELLK